MSLSNFHVTALLDETFLIKLLCDFCISKILLILSKVVCSLKIFNYHKVFTFYLSIKNPKTIAPIFLYLLNTVLLGKSKISFD